MSIPNPVRVEDSHGLQGVQKGLDIPVVVTFQPSGKPLHLHFPQTIADSPHTLQRTIRTRYSVLKTNEETAEGLERPTCRQSQITQTAAMISIIWPCTFSPICGNLHLG